MMNRTEYLQSKDPNAHREYYAQFVDEYVMRFVDRSIGHNAIMNSTDPHLNDILLVKWDRLETAIRGFCIGKMAEINGVYSNRMVGFSLSDTVCIAKEAAKQIKEKQHAGDYRL